MANGDTKTESYLRVAAEGTRADIPTDTCCDTKTQSLILGVANRIMDVEDEVEELKNNPDVVDIVDTYQDLQDYDTSTLTDKDIIRVLEDSTHSNNSTFYRWNATTNQFDYIGEVSGGGGDGDSVYSTKTTSNANNGGAVYIGNLNASQEEQLDPTTTDNHYRYFYALPYDNPTSSQAPKNGSINILGECQGEGSIVLGLSAYDTYSGYYQTVIGEAAHSSQSSTVAIGFSAGTSAANSVAIGRAAVVDSSQCQNSVALGSYARATRKGEVNIGTNGNNLGYNNTDYRVIGGVHDGLDAHDAMTVGQANALIDAINTALSTNIPHIGS